MLEDVEWLGLDDHVLVLSPGLGNWDLLWHLLHDELMLLGMVVNVLWWSEHLAHEVTKWVECLVVWHLLSLLLVLLVVWWGEHGSEQAAKWIKLLVVGLSLGWGSLGDRFVMLVVWLEEGLGGSLNFLEEVLDSLEEINEVWEHQTEFIHLGHMSVLLDLIMEFLLEHTSLNVLGLNRLIPLNVNTVHIGAKLSKVNRSSVNLIHKFLVGVA